MKVVKVRIKKASKPTYWYADIIGSVLECYHHGRHFSVINNSDFNKKYYGISYGVLHFIELEDAEIIKESFIVHTQIKKIKF